MVSFDKCSKGGGGRRRRRRRRRSGEGGGRGMQYQKRAGSNFKWHQWYLYINYTFSFLLEFSSSLRFHQVQDFNLTILMYSMIKKNAAQLTITEWTTQWTWNSKCDLVSRWINNFRKEKKNDFDWLIQTWRRTGANQQPLHIVFTWRQ